MSTDSFIELETRIPGQYFYLSKGTIGLIWLGAIEPIEKALHKPTKTTNDEKITNQKLLIERAICIFLFLTIIQTTALFSLMLTTLPDASETHLDQWMFGRYFNRSTFSFY